MRAGVEDDEDSLEVGVLGRGPSENADAMEVVAGRRSASRPRAPKRRQDTTG